MSDFNEVWFVVQAADGETYRIKGSELSTKLKDNKLLIENGSDYQYVNGSSINKTPNSAWAICYDEESDENYRVPGYTLKAGSTFDPSLDPKFSVDLIQKPTTGTFNLVLKFSKPTLVEGPAGLSWLVPGDIVNETIIPTDVEGKYFFDSSGLVRLAFDGSGDSKFVISDQVYTANITDMSNMFWGCTEFNQDLSWFDTGSCEVMRSMFKGAKTFNNGGNPDIVNWEIGNVVDMVMMFENAIAFDQDLSEWCVANHKTNTDAGNPNDPLDWLDTFTDSNGDDYYLPRNFAVNAPIEGDEDRLPVVANPDCVSTNPDPNDPNNTLDFTTLVVTTDDDPNYTSPVGTPVDVADNGYKSRGYEIGGEIQPELTLVRGEKYVFDRNHPSNTVHTDVLNIYTGEANGVKWLKGVTLTAQKTTIFKVPFDAPDTLYYQSSQAPKGRLGGKINITD